MAKKNVKEQEHTERQVTLKYNTRFSISHIIRRKQIKTPPRDISFQPIRNTGECSYSLLQGIFLTQGSNPDLLHCRHILYCLSHQGSPDGILLSHKKNKILPFAKTWMDLEDIMLNEISQRNTNTLCYHLYVECKKTKGKNITKQKQTCIYRQVTSGYWQGKEMGENRKGNN